MPLSRRTTTKLLLSIIFTSLFPFNKAMAKKVSMSATLIQAIRLLIPTSNAKLLAKQLYSPTDNSTIKDDLLLWGGRWLNQQSLKHFGDVFHKIAVENQLLILKKSESSPNASLAQLFFANFRNRTMALHYASEYGRSALGLQLSPQPKGYLSHNHPPQSIGKSNEYKV